MKAFNFSVLTAGTFLLQHTEAATEVFCNKRSSLKFRKIHRKTPVPESLF